MCACASFLGRCLCSLGLAAEPRPCLSLSLSLSLSLEVPPLLLGRASSRVFVCLDPRRACLARLCICVRACLQTPWSVLPLRGPVSVGFVAGTSLAAGGFTRTQRGLFFCGPDALSFFLSFLRNGLLLRACTDFVGGSRVASSPSVLVAVRLFPFLLCLSISVRRVFRAPTGRKQTPQPSPSPCGSCLFPFGDDRMTKGPFR
nr:hypothetical protein [Pandoravirus aubagnensis]